MIVILDRRPHRARIGDPRLATVDQPQRVPRATQRIVPGGIAPARRERRRLAFDLAREQRPRTGRDVDAVHVEIRVVVRRELDVRRVARAERVARAARQRYLRYVARAQLRHAARGDVVQCEVRIVLRVLGRSALLRGQLTVAPVPEVQVDARRRRRRARQRNVRRPQREPRAVGGKLRATRVGGERARSEPRRRGADGFDRHAAVRAGDHQPERRAHPRLLLHRLVVGVGIAQPRERRAVGREHGRHEVRVAVRDERVVAARDIAHADALVGLRLHDVGDVRAVRAHGVRRHVRNTRGVGVAEPADRERGRRVLARRLR